MKNGLSTCRAAGRLILLQHPGNGRSSTRDCTHIREQLQTQAQPCSLRPSVCWLCSSVHATCCFGTRLPDGGCCSVPVCQ